MTKPVEFNLTMRETAVRLGVSLPTLCRLMHSGLISYYAIRGRRLFSESHVQEFLKSVERKSRGNEAEAA